MTTLRETLKDLTDEEFKFAKSIDDVYQKLDDGEQVIVRTVLTLAMVTGNDLPTDIKHDIINVAVRACVADFVTLVLADLINRPDDQLGTAIAVSGLKLTRASDTLHQRLINLLELDVETEGKKS